ncbi:SDR family NAD(P)-dependent oxidoreductase, partial [bacterium]|nr:SDR family NAD(P)-dependent oxidoreductase [bacterium]
MKFYNDKIAYVTGGSSGIGLEIAKQLVAQGAHVAIIARNQANLDKALKEVEAAKINHTQKVKTISLDVTDHLAVNRKMKQNTVDFGFPDLLVVNAGVGYADYLEKISYENFDQVIQTNVYGARNIVFSILPEMKQKGGHITFVASLSGFAGVPGYTAYGTSKYALVGMAECLRS